MINKNQNSLKIYRMKKFTFLMILSLLTLFSTAQEANFNWVEEIISEDNTIKGMTVTGDTSAILIGYDNTFKKTSDNGLNWSDIKIFDPEFNFMGMCSAGDVTFMSSLKAKIVDHPSGGFNDVYTSGVLLKSIDMGTSWSIMDISKIGTGELASVNPNANGGYSKNIYAVGALNSDTIILYSGWYDITSGTRTSRGGIFLTKDGGEVWETIVTGLGSNIITSIIAQDSIILSGGSKSLFKTNLRTNTTTNIYPNLAVGTDSNLFVNAITIVNLDSFYITTTTDGIFRTADGGETFTQLDGIGGANDLYLLNDSSFIVLGSSTKSMVTTDKGESWTNCYPGSTCYKIGGILGDTLYGLAKSNVYKISVDDLVSKNFNWSTTLINDGEMLKQMSIYDENNAIIGSYGEVCKKTTDGGQSWSTITLPEDYEEDIEFDFNDISANDANAFSVVRLFQIADLSEIDSVNNLYMEGLILKTTDNWATYSLIDASKIGENEGDDVTKNPQLENCWGLNPYTIECVDANTAYLYAKWYEDFTTGEKEDRGRVFKTTDGGDSWNSITKDFEGSYISGIKFIGDTGYIAGNKILLKTTDGGNTFTDLYPTMVAANSDSSIYLKDVIAINTKEFYIPTTSDGVFITTDGGDSFSKFDGVSGTSDFYKFDQNSFLCMGTTSKSLFTNDGGATWQNASVGTTVYSIGEVLNDSLYTLSKGKIFKIALTDLQLTTSIKEIKLDDELSVRYKPATIELVSTKHEIERCKVYSITGRLISVSEPNNITYELQRSNFQPGIYIIDALIEGKRHTKKIIF
ncbi:MAG: T9SS type A sorting domain-containing protein [Draconibacterium sp.]|nr:T9SS type A sorting domain-containing protein [Draconibacterium sp.]